MLHFFVVNPTAGRGRAERLIACLQQAARERGLNYRLAIADRPGRATELTKQAAADGAGVVAVGGDGTIHEVLNGLNEKTVLGIVPLGTCNDIARNLGLIVGQVGNLSQVIQAALDIITTGHVWRVDCARCGDRRFLSVAAMGLDSRVAMSHRNLPRLFRRRLAYTLLLFGHLLVQRPSLFRLAIDGETVEQKAWLVSAANTECYGGGMRIAPRARPDDGRLHVCLVGEGPRREIVRSLPLVYRGAHLSHPMVRAFEGREVSVSCAAPTPIIADGEHIGWLPATIQIEPQAIALLAPKKGR